MNGVKVLLGRMYRVAVAVQVGLGVPVMIAGVKLKVGEGDAGVRLKIAVVDAVAAGVTGPGLIITATHPRQ
jgi:hypothetical protein